MNEDITHTLKWWIQHAKELEVDRDKWRKIATEIRESLSSGLYANKKLDSAIDIYEEAITSES